MRLKLMLVAVLFVFSYLYALGISVGIRLHGHIEPFFIVSINTGEFDIQLKNGFIFDDSGIALLVPGVFISKDFGSFRVHTGFEGFIQLEEKKCLLLGKIGANFGMTLGVGSLFLGGEFGLPINLPGEFFVKVKLRPIPTLTAYFEF
ncbi:hypothetical protein [Kosmotoga pacifica]|nr:hypothetical protein [Kosmotoga pacifica]